MKTLLLKENTLGTAVLERLNWRMRHEGNVIDALIGELTYLALEGNDDEEIEGHKMADALAWSINMAIKDRQRLGGANRGWPIAAQWWPVTAERWQEKVLEEDAQ
jgi:hypothetical protein